ncbi:MAG: hypothetical protein V3V61_01860, partial [Gammaproteobacteria bacterium]
MVSKTIRIIMIAFAAGCAGGLANSLVAWLVGYLHITTLLGVSLVPQFTPAWLYPRIVWGGLWGLLFLIPILSKILIARGILLSLPLTFVQLYIVFPSLEQGYLGLSNGFLTPLFVLLFNAVWGIVGVYLFRLGKLKNRPQTVAKSQP